MTFNNVTIEIHKNFPKVAAYIENKIVEIYGETYTIKITVNRETAKKIFTDLGIEWGYN